MEALSAIGFFVFGAIIGSFLNVVILRYNTGVTFHGRSHCFSCGKIIRWYDLIPLLSFFLLRGRCRFCKSKLSAQYPLVEWMSALLFLGVFIKNSQFVFFMPYSDLSLEWLLLVVTELAVFSTLLVIAVYDIKHKIIPDILVFIFGVLALIHLGLITPLTSLFHMPYLLDLCAGPLIALPVFLLWVISKGRWIGLGDAKLLLGVGWFLGFSFSISAVIIGFWIGAIVGVVLLGVSKWGGDTGRKLTLKSELPLAPFLILGLVIVYFFHVDVMGLRLLMGVI